MVKSYRCLDATVTELAERLRDHIRDGGPMRFRDWMEACLYDEDAGYYMRPGKKTGPGADADFATSPTLHPFMAQAIAKEAQDVAGRLGSDALTVVEFGGGEGDLARDALAKIDEIGGLDVDWVHVERSPTHRGAQAGDERLRWAGEMPETDALVVAHEFVDALPVHVLERRKGNWAESLVGLDGDRFVETLGFPSRRAIEAAPKRLVEDGTRVTAMADARAWIKEVAHRLERGRIVVVDYGDRGRDLWDGSRPDATVRGFQGQRLVEDVLSTPGHIDITASVDFTQLREWGRESDLVEASFGSQEAFLVEHGALEALAAAPRDTVEDASAYLRLKQLVMPQGMGSAFKVQRLERGIADE